MQFQEEVYTSAASLLEGRGGGNLGVVAKSRGFPREVEGDMALLRGYTLLDKLAVDNVQHHPPRFTVTSHRGNQEWVCLSRVVFAGADHTGRTTPLAHHLAFDVAALKAARVSPAALLTAAEPLFYQRWDEPPKWIEPTRSLAQSASPEAIGQFPSAAWDAFVDPQSRDALLAVVAQHLVSFKQSKKSVVICLPITASMNVCRLMADILAVLPDEVQLPLTCASHVIDPSDAPTNAALIFTYPGTRLLKQANERRDARSPFVFDLSGRAPAPPIEGDYALVIASVLRSGKAPAELPRLRELWEQLGIDPTRVGQFRQALLLRNRLQKLRSLGDLAAIGAQLGAVTAISSSAAHCVEQWSLKYVLRALQQWPPEDRKSALLTIATDARWPAALVQAGRRTMREQIADFLPWLMDRVAAGTAGQGSLVPLISELLASNPAVVAQLISRASSTGTPRDKNVALAAIEHSGAVHDSQLQTWLDAALGGDDGVRRGIIAPILLRLTEGAPSAAQNISLRNRYRQRADVERPFLEEVYLPLLRNSLHRAGAAEVWRALAYQLVEASLDSGNESRELTALFATHASRLNHDIVEDWRRHIAADLQGATRSARLERALEDAGLRMLIAPAKPYSSADVERNGRDWTPRRPPIRRGQQPIGKGGLMGSIGLAVVTAALLALPAKLGSDWRGIFQPPPQILFWTSAAILVAWVVAELVLYFTPLSGSAARRVRLTILVFLVTGCLLSASGCLPSAYRLGRAKWSDWFKLPAAAASANA